MSQLINNITTSTTNVNYNSSSSSGTLITRNSNNYNWSQYSGNVIYQDNSEVIKFVEFALNLMGIDITYQEFVDLSEADKKSLIRNKKLKDLLE